MAGTARIFFETRLTGQRKCGKIVAPKGCLKFNFMIFRLHECHHIGFTANGGGGVPVSVSLPGNRALALFCRAQPETGPLWQSKGAFLSHVLEGIMFDQAAIEAILDYRFTHPALLRQAFTRSSYRNEHPDCPDNEVLELIGDSVLSLTVLTWFRERYMVASENGLLTGFDEGQLSAMKNGLVNKQHLSDRMRRLGLSRFLLVSRGDRETGIWRENSVMEDLFESIIGAIYVDAGCRFEVVGPIVRQMLDIERMPLPEKKNIRLSWKNELQERTQKADNSQPVYRTVRDELLPGNAHRFTVSCSALGMVVTGTGKNGKAAQEDAAERFCRKLDELGR